MALWSAARSRPRALLRAALLVACCLTAAACIHVFGNVRVRDLADARGSDSTWVRTPVKAHLHDGQTVTFTQGVLVARDTLRGVGMRYGLDGGTGAPVDRVPLDSVAAMESYANRVNTGATFLTSTLATAVTAAAVVVAAKAIFGSCPTFYTDSAGVPVLEAEGFSYSIAPLFERRDVDRLRAAAADDGVVRVELRNEAPETHYLNHVELLEVSHALDELVVPAPDGRPLALREVHPLAAARDRDGRDVLAALAAGDGHLFSTARARLAAARPDDLEDHIELVAPTGGADSAAVLLRLRNSLLNTVLLYDEILAASGAAAFDWQGEALQRIAGAVELGRWYSSSMGLRVHVHDGHDWRPVAHVGDAGPIAFHDVAVPVPTFGRDTLRVRLAFTADNWRIDRAAVATDFRAAEPRPVPVHAALAGAGLPDSAALAGLREPDETYLVTSPGQRFMLEFRPGAATAPARTFLLASQGYYVEWMRGDWLRAPRRRGAFVPGDDALYAALRRWEGKQPDFERQFYASRIPVR